jgi:hypothetical protein
MKPKIKLEGYSDTMSSNLRVIFGGAEIATAYDCDYESNDASKCCELLKALETSGIIELEVDDFCRKHFL